MDFMAVFNTTENGFDGTSTIAPSKGPSDLGHILATGA